MSEAPAIDLHDLHKTYRDGWLGRRRVEALRGVSFAVRRGEIFGLLGPNGAGKTTLIKVLLGIVRRSQGTASLLGHSVGDRQGRQRVGYLPENHRIPRHHTGNSALLYYGALSGLPRREIRARSPALLESVGLGQWGTTPVRKYSKGMLQRLGLAQALLHNPDLLILDEPTDGVDPVGRSEMRTLLQKLKADGKTIFINSHLLQELELVCDRIVILDHGRVLHEGKISDITVRPETEIQVVLVAEEETIRRALGNRQIVEWLIMGEEQFEVTLPAPTQQFADELIDDLRRHGVSLISMSRSRMTLEQAFLSIIAAARENS